MDYESRPPGHRRTPPFTVAVMILAFIVFVWLMFRLLHGRLL
jgi:hypothetical protein